MGGKLGLQRPREPVSAVLPRGHIQRLPTHTSFCLLFLRSHALAFKEDASPLPSTGKHSILSYTETQDCPSPTQPRLSVLLVSKAGTYVTKLREGSHTLLPPCLLSCGHPHSVAMGRQERAIYLAHPALSSFLAHHQCQDPSYVPSVAW